MKTWHLGLAVLMSMAAASAAAEEQGCCAGCGDHCCLKPVCRLVCEPKTEVDVVYDCRCEDFCTPGPSQKCGEVCEKDCHGHAKKHILWKPSCGHVRHRNVLIKHEVAKEVPHYECVVEYVCDRCCGQCGRVPCDQAGRLVATARQHNADPDRSTAAKVTEADKTASKRRFFWPALFARQP